MQDRAAPTPLSTDEIENPLIRCQGCGGLTALDDEAKAQLSQLLIKERKKELNELLDAVVWDGQVTPNFGSANGSIVAGAIRQKIVDRIAQLESELKEGTAATWPIDTKENKELAP